MNNTSYLEKCENIEKYKELVKIIWHSHRVIYNLVTFFSCVSLDLYPGIYSWI